MPSNFEEADTELKLTPQEKNLYMRHLNNLWGAGGVDHEDGSRSTLYQAVQEHDGKYYNVPMVWDGKIESEQWTRPTDGKTFDVPNATALQNIGKTGWDSFPAYSDPEEADKRYNLMHDYIEKDTKVYFDAMGKNPEY